MMTKVEPSPTSKSVTISKKRDLFERIAAWTTRATGGRWGFLTALAAIIVWAMAGPFFHYSENWQLVINTGTTIITFLMVFLIQNAQNRESRAIHIKLDELIFAMTKARNELIDIENLTEQQLNALSLRYTKLAEKYQENLEECFHAEDQFDEVDQAPAMSDKPTETTQRAARTKGKPNGQKVT